MRQADLNDIAAQVAKTGDGRGGRRPGAGRPRKDGSPPKNKTPPPAPDFPVPDIDDLLGDGPPPPLVEPPKFTSDSDAKGDDLGGVALTLPADPGALYAGAKARREAALAAKAELDFRIKAGQYIPREAYRTATATAYAAIAQTLRSIPDNLERKLGVSPEVADAVGRFIDDAMGDLANELEKSHRDNAATATD